MIKFWKKHYGCNMKLYEKLRTNTEAVQQKMVEAKKNECATALKEVKHLCKEFGFMAGKLKGALAKGGRSNEKR